MNEFFEDPQEYIKKIATKDASYKINKYGENTIYGYLDPEVFGDFITYLFMCIDK